jgi:predicted transcriptional regulator
MAIGTNGITISGIQLKTSISYQHLTYLVQIDLVIYEKEEKKFRITQQGLRALDTYAGVGELLVRNTLHNIIKTPEYYFPFP